MNIATEEDIINGRTTDIYFIHTKKILDSYGLGKKIATAEVTVDSIKFEPEGEQYAIFCGLGDILSIFEGKKIDLYSIPEGTVFFPYSSNGVRIPVISIRGEYGNFCIYETPLLGSICQASGVATMTSRVRRVAKDKILLSFGIRRMHPSIAPMLDYATYIGGCDYVSSIIGAERLGIEPRGTMPHALIILFGNQAEAFKAFDKVIEKNVPRICLVDTYYDEKIESIIACESVKNIYGIRLDTPSSRKGKFEDIVKEVRWELDIRGYKDVKIFVSGGLDEKNIPSLIDAGADGFGVGTSLSNAPTINFAFDVVEVDGLPRAKRGKFGGRKFVYRCEKCLNYKVFYEDKVVKCCGEDIKPIHRQYIKDGKIIEKIPEPKKVREYVLNQLGRLKDGHN
ncbi:MAG: nicotinate phosphoribosyltransferase [Candidatus Thermoplasmatota archaeon]